MHKNTKCILIKNTLSDSFQTGSRLKKILQYFHIKSRLSCLAIRLFFAIFAIHLHNSYFSMSHKIKIIILLCIASVVAHATQPIFSNKDLTATEIERGVTVLETSDKTTLYLVEGDSAALLIDTGTSIADLDKVVAKLTQKPFHVVATHGHPDHIGNIRFFPEFYMHPGDTVLSTPQLKEYNGRVLPIVEGDRFELGGRTLEVIHTPGHTPGSITLIDYANHMAFTGDAFGSGQLWMQLQPQIPFVTLTESCGCMIEIMAEKGVDKLYVGHYPYLKRPLGIDYLIDINLAARAIDSGDTASAVPFSNEAMLLRHGTAEIVFLPEAAGLRQLTPKRVMLKLDDVHYGEGDHAVPPRWNRLIDYLKTNHLKANLGIIGYSLQSNRTDFFRWLQQTDSIDGIEFWNHGFHNRTGLDEPGEFEQDFASQQQALHLTDSLCIAKTGITLHAWGPHWTNCNEFTDSALATIPNIQLVLGHQTLPVLNHYKGLRIHETLEMEYPFHNPVYNKFLINYLGRWRNCNTFYLQGHPNSWDDARWKEFEKIIERLKADGTQFINLSEYIANPDGNCQ